MHTTCHRSILIDFLRGVAIICMVVYHFCYDLFLFGWIEIHLQQDVFWVGFRWFIVSLFLLLVGISLQLAHRKNLNQKHFYQRLLWLLLCAGLVSVGSYFLFSDRFIYFGILQFILVASLIAVWFRGYYYTNLFIGIGSLLLGNLFHRSIFNTYAFNWLGFVTEQPATEDYVPLFPWLGVVFIGLFIGKWLQQQPNILNVLKPATWHNPVCFLGRHSLWVYMLHQPILLGLLTVILFFTTTSPSAI